MFIRKYELRDEATEGGDGGTGGEKGAEGGTQEGKEGEGGGTKKENGGEGTEGGKGNNAGASGKAANSGDGNKASNKSIALKLGKDSILSDDDLSAVVKLASEKGLGQKEAEELLETFEDSVGSRMEAQESALKEKVTGWKTEAEKSETFKEDEVLVNDAMEKFGDEDFSKTLKESGYNNWPPLRSFLKKIGEAMKDDSSVKGQESSGASGENKSLGAAMYPEMLKK